LKTTLNNYLDERGLDPENFGDYTVEFALEVIRQVQSENVYTLSPGAMPEDRDFVEYFLTENHKGYCVHFATAVAALLRSAGIPARYVEGFVVSPDDPKAKDGFTELTDNRAHAWAEIYVNGEGWIPVESTPGRQSGITIPWQASAIGIPASETPTPSVAGITSAGATSGSATNVTIGAASGNGDKETSAGGIAGGAAGPSGNRSADSAANIGSALGSPIPWAVASAILTLILAACVVRSRRVAERKRSFESEDRRKAVLAAYSYIENLTIFIGKRERSEESPESVLPQELMDLVMEARFSKHEPPQDAMEKLIAYAEELSARAKRDMPPLRLLCGKYVYGLF
jgi:hypothetical protein